VALKKYTDRTPLTMDVQTDEKNAIIPAMPDDLFEMEDMLKTQLAAFPLQSSYQAEECLVALWKVDTVPMKPNFAFIENDSWRAAICSDLDKLSLMYPKEIIPINIGSNEGLARILRTHYEQEKQDKPGECKKYSALNVDENIFKRTLKVHHIIQSDIVHKRHTYTLHYLPPPHHTVQVPSQPHIVIKIYIQ
jgi:hypothetical protein